MARRIFGWHTPDEYEEADSICRPLFVPLPFVHIVGGALVELTKTHNWEQVGTMTPQRATEIMTAMLRDWYEDDCMDCQTLLDCLYNADQLTRVNPETGRLETSSDGGETWQESTANDPRFNSSRMDLGGTVTCADALYMVGLVQRLVNEQTAQLDLGTGILGGVAALNGVLALLFSFSPVGAIAITAVTALGAFTSAAIDAALTGDVWERLLCNFQCNLDGEGQVSTAAFDTILAQIAADESGIAEVVVWNLVNTLGPVGLQNAVAMRVNPTGLPADCDDCNCIGAWCRDFNFNAGQQGWEPNETVGGTPTASWAGVYWAPVTIIGERNLRIEIQVPADCLITDVEIYGTAWSTPPTQAFFGNEQTGEVVAISPIPSNSYHYTATGLSIEMNAGDYFRLDNFRPANTGGDWAFTRVILRGTGGDPFSTGVVC